ncbi:MAG: S24/S26 family peptidase [Butyrivibrio sp.]|nr:S24/S26 family peptidase [Acetatifactor muris]MCM1559279.1 S24/S26 family peptidase [Butyrivibrio sp.]
MEEKETAKKGDGRKGVDIEALLSEGKSIRIHPQGYSMYPLFVPGRDEAVIAPVETRKLKRGDVVLYRREGSILVLHRIWKRKPEGFYMVGDNQSEVEGPLRAEQIKGILCQVVRRGKCFSVSNLLYRIPAAVWLWLRPARPFLSKAAAKVKRVLKGKK